MLEKVFTKDVIRLNVEAADWESAVRAGGQLLLNAGKCRPDYIDAMVQTVRQFGPYMVLTPGLALAHARPEDGALEVGLSLITLKDPVEFGSEANDPVMLVIAFCAEDKERHTGLLKELASFLRKEKNQQLLINATTADEILSAFSHNEE